MVLHIYQLPNINVTVVNNEQNGDNEETIIMMVKFMTLIVVN